jgi:hypothetical protein
MVQRNICYLTVVTIVLEEPTSSLTDTESNRAEDGGRGFFKNVAFSKLHNVIIQKTII